MIIFAERIKEWIGRHQMLAGAVIILGLAAGYFLSVYLRRPADAWIYVSLVNEYHKLGKGSDLYDGFVRQQGIQGQRVVFDNEYFFDLTNPKDEINPYFQKLVAYLEAGTTDALICEEDNLFHIAKGGRVLDLRDKRVAALCRKYRDRFYCYESDDGRIPVGISLAGSRFLPELGYEKSVYLAFSCKAGHAGRVGRLLDYLLES